ncbi:hypothetical protein L6164_004477 [Bauhinia variegata]|uniref:Uncharacterized protein n=1 Tax=Bauhinia variegata TaxID=167791 RepID=A0ACB9QA25_BAUVA|nr:hypothetical protein L6164_004477 [Bauhinia variegata]
MVITDHYQILPIRDAVKCINQKVNLLGVIIEVGFPKRSKGTDYCCTLKIIDEPHQRIGMSVNFFVESSQSFPQIAACGDIILLYHVHVRMHGTEVNAVFNKKFSSFALYEGKDGKDFVPYEVSSKFNPHDLDRETILELRKWLVDFQLREDFSNFITLSELKEGDYADLACKILQCCEAAADKWMVFVWDGTDAPPNSISANLEEEMDRPLPLQLENGPLPIDLLRTFPTVGSILRITFDQAIVNNQLHLLKIGKWVKFVNMRFEVHAGLWSGVLTPFTKLRYAPNEDSLALSRQRKFDERISLMWGKMPFWCFPEPSCITVVGHESVIPVTLMDVITHSEVTAKFKCVVRVVAVLPSQPKYFCSPVGVYRMRLTLEDPTARIQAFVYAEDGETLFDGYPGVDILQSKMNRLLGLTSDLAILTLMSIVHF